MQKKPNNLVEYGITTEQSDIRAHVAPSCQRIFVYQTRIMRDLLDFYDYPEAGADQAQVEGITGWGKLVPLNDIPDLRTLHFASYSWDSFPPRTASTSERGAAAVAVVIELLRMGHFPLWLAASEEQNPNVQVNGTDIIIYCRQRIQVKCDWRAGKRAWHPACTGNLFVQTAERNPRRLT